MQNIVVFLIVAVAVAFLVRNFMLSARGQKGCGSCASGGCKSAAEQSLPSGMSTEWTEIFFLQIREGSAAIWAFLGAVVLVYFVLAMQCMSTLAVVKRETNGWKWPLFMQVYLTALAWIASFVVYQGGRLLGWG